MSQYVKVVPCSHCKGECVITRYYDEQGMVEKDIKCRNCDYHFNWSYGNETIEGDEIN